MYISFALYARHCYGKERKEKFIKSMDRSLTKIEEKKRSIKDINHVI